MPDSTYDPVEEIVKTLTEIDTQTRIFMHLSRNCPHKQGSDYTGDYPCREEKNDAKMCLPQLCRLLTMSK